MLLPPEEQKFASKRASDAGSVWVKAQQRTDGPQLQARNGAFHQVQCTASKRSQAQTDICEKADLPICSQVLCHAHEQEKNMAECALLNKHFSTANTKKPKK
eukprot:scaffold322577_cov17-Tisochrysis_lutea.AAC.1